MNFPICSQLRAARSNHSVRLFLRRGPGRPYRHHEARRGRDRPVPDVPEPHRPPDRRRTCTAHPDRHSPAKWSRSGRNAVKDQFRGAGADPLAIPCTPSTLPPVRLVGRDCDPRVTKARPGPASPGGAQGGGTFGCGSTHQSASARSGDSAPPATAGDDLTQAVRPAAPAGRPGGDSRHSPGNRQRPLTARH